jgi:hypothetical protein
MSDKLAGGTGEAHNAGVSTEPRELPVQDKTYQQAMADAAIESAKLKVQKNKANLAAAETILANAIAEREALN